MVRLYEGQLGGAVPAEGIRLREVKDRLRREVLDAKAEVRCRSRTYGSRRRGHTLQVRLVGVPNTERGVDFRYLTNLASEVVPAKSSAHATARAGPSSCRFER